MLLDLLVEKSPNLKNDKLLLTDVSYNKSQKSLFGKGRGWSPSPFKKQWSPSPKGNKGIGLEFWFKYCYQS